MYHLAQMKHIFPEGLLLEKTMAPDEKTLCMKPDLKITLLHDVVLSGKEKASKGNNTLGFRKAFHSRLVAFVKAYPKVAPTELEELLLSNPDITDATVISYPDEEAGQVPMSFVVRKPGSNLCEEDVIFFVAKQVSPYKKIRQVAFVTSIPKSPFGKFLRKYLIYQVLSTKL